jgi:hypothetical protein
MLNLPYDPDPVDSLHCPSPEAFRHRVDAAMAPFKVTGVLERWELARALAGVDDPRAKCDYLGRTASQTVSYTVIPPEQKGALGLNEKQEENFSFRSGQAPFPRFMEEVKGYLANPDKGNLYLQSTPIDEFNAKLGELDLFEGFLPLTQPRFWIGTGAQFVALHNDPFRNIIAVFAGRKRVILFPPEALPHLHMAPFDKRIGTVLGSMVDVFHPDFDTYPGLRTALPMARVAIVNPGEFLYMPPFWFHAVEGEGFNVGINCWFFEDDRSDMLAKHLYVPAHALLADLHRSGLTDSARTQLHAQFMRTLESGAPPSGDGVGLRVEQEALRLRTVLQQAPVTAPQRAVWTDWARVFTEQFIFRIHGNPYPSLGEQAYEQMLERIFARERPVRRGPIRRLKDAGRGLHRRWTAWKLARAKRSMEHAFVPAPR